MGKSSSSSLSHSKQVSGARRAPGCDVMSCSADGVDSRAAICSSTLVRVRVRVRVRRARVRARMRVRARVRARVSLTLTLA